MLKTISKKYGNFARDLKYVSGWNCKLSFAFSQMKFYLSVAKQGSTQMTPKSKINHHQVIWPVSDVSIDSVGCSSFGPAGGFPETFKVPWCGSGWGMTDNDRNWVLFFWGLFLCFFSSILVPFLIFQLFNTQQLGSNVKTIGQSDMIYV